MAASIMPPPESVACPRRRTILIALLGGIALPAHALMGDGESARDRLDYEQSRRFRAWMTTLIASQLEMGPSPRWSHRDCAGLVRFAVRESLRQHDASWVRANGLQHRRLPPEIEIASRQRMKLLDWTGIDGRRTPYVSALALIQGNSRFIGKNLAQAIPGDMLFFDQGDEQHLMVWMGRYIAYHTGTETPTDHGLRSVAPRRLMQWRDTRWRPLSDNSNFIGVFRLAFLSD